MDPFLREANDEEALEEAHQAASRFIGAARPEGHAVEPKQSSDGGAYLALAWHLQPPAYVSMHASCP
jgi:hypothetical protein